MPSIAELKNSKEKQDSFILSLAIHLLLLLFFLFPMFSFYQKEPAPPEFQGIQVALGTPDYTENKSAPVKESSPSKAKAAKSKAKVKPQKAVKKPAQPAKATPIVSKTVAENEEMVATKKKVVSKKNTKLTTDKIEDASKLKEAEAQKKREQEQELARQKALEARKQKEAAEAEAKRQEAAAKAKKAKAKSKFSSLVSNDSSEAGPTAGQENGSPNAKALEGMTRGMTSKGDGLGDRDLIFAPPIEDNSQKTGKVVVSICVSSSGKVSSAKYTQKGSTTTESYLIDLAVSNAKKYQFTKSEVAKQCGNIVIDFKLR